MTTEERNSMERLCKQIAVEKDPKKFIQLVHELDELLHRVVKRLGPQHIT